MRELNRLAIKDGLRAGLKPDYEKNNSGVIVEIGGSIFADVSKHRIWVQPVGTDTTPVVVFSDDQLVDLEAGTEVIYAQDPEPPEIWRFVKVNRSAYSNQVNELGNLPAANLTKHALEHTINQDFIGSDPMMVYGRMIARFNVQPTNPATNKVLILPGSYAGDTYHQFITKIRVSSDLVTGNVPSTSNMAALVAISQDSSGSLTFTKGTEFSKSEEVPPIYCYPDVPAEDELLALIYLEQGDTTVTNASFRYDQRSIGSGGGRSKVAKVYTPDLTTEVISTDASSQVGIGTTTPATRLHISKDTTTAYADAVPNAADTAESLVNTDDHVSGGVQAGIQFNLQGDSQNRVGYIGAITESAANRKLSLVFATDSGSNRNERMRLTGDGDVGIGTTTPATRLHVSKDTTTAYADAVPNAADTGGSLVNTDDHVSGGVQTGIQFNLSGDSQNRLGYIGAITESAANRNLSLVFATDPGTGSRTEKLRITGAGDVGIGTTSPAGQLDVDQSSASGAIPVLRLDQADVSEEMIEFETTIGTGNAIEAVGAKTLTTTHFIKVTLPGGLTRYIPAGTIA